jgi:hypothetical protein
MKSPVACGSHRADPPTLIGNETPTAWRRLVWPVCSFADRRTRFGPTCGNKATNAAWAGEFAKLLSFTKKLWKGKSAVYSLQNLLAK